MFDLVIRGGTVVTASDTTVCDVAVRDGRIAAIAEHVPAAGREIDAGGKLVLPGGVDAHCHVAQKSSSGLMTADDFYTASLSAACGGTTTIIPFAAQHRGESLRTVVARYHERAAGDAVIDYAFHLIVSDLSGEVLSDELPELVRDGYASFKVFMTYDALRLTDRQLLDVLALARREGALVMVHAENHDAISWLTEQLVLEHRTAPRFHAASRPPGVEAEAVHRAIKLAELADVPVVIVHVTSNEAVQEICAARARGARVFAETCPQYLLLTSEDLDRPGFEGAKYVCSPPLRDVFDQDALWQAVADGVFDIVSSDHAGYRFDDPNGKKAHGDHAPFTKIPNGVPGLETRLPLLFSEGVGRRRLSLNAFVTLTSANPARLFGLYPRKGTIAIGSDADLTIWDPDLDVTIASDRLHDAMDYTAYEGMKVRGWPVTTISRGDIIWANGEVHGRSRTRPVPRARTGPAGRAGAQGPASRWHLTESEARPLFACGKMDQVTSLRSFTDLGGEFDASRFGGAMRLTTVCSALFVLVAAVSAAAQTPAAPAPAPPPPPPFTGSIGAGLAATSGNTDTSTFNVTFNAAYDPKTRNVVKAEGLFLRGTSNGVTNVDRTTLVGRDQYKLTERAFVFGQMQYLRDRFKDVSYLIAPSAGVGYKLVDTAVTTLSADAGIGGVWEKDTGLDVTASGAVTANQKLMHKISASATLNEAVSALWKTNDFGDALYTFGGGLALGVTTRLQVKIELLDTYKNRPPSPSIKKNDVATILALVYKF